MNSQNSRKPSRFLWHTRPACDSPTKRHRQATPAQAGSPAHNCFFSGCNRLCAMPLWSAALPRSVKMQPSPLEASCIPPDTPGDHISLQENASEPLVVHEGNVLHGFCHVQQTWPALWFCCMWPPGLYKSPRLSCD